MVPESKGASLRIQGDPPPSDGMERGQDPLAGTDNREGRLGQCYGPYSSGYLILGKTLGCNLPGLDFIPNKFNRPGGSR